MAETAVPQAGAPAAPKAAAGKKKRGPKKSTVIVLVVLAVLLAVGGIALYRFLADSGEEQGEIFSQPASIGTIQSSVSGSGNARAKESAAITLTQSGTVQEVYVAAGETVYAGQPLYTIYSQAAEQAVSDAQKKVDNLYQDLADLQEKAASLTVTAPFAGKLMEVKEFNLDDQVGEGTPVATLVNDKILKLSLYFSYAYENDISVGQTVSVSIPAVMGVYTGTVEKINRVSYISPEGAVHFEVVVTFENPGTLTADMAASAVLTAADGTEIYPYENGKTQFYESREILARASGPVVGIGNLLNYANVSAGEGLLFLGSSNIDSQIRDMQAEIEKAESDLAAAQEGLANFNAVAPIDGTVTSCTLSEGMEVKSGDTVVMISNTVIDMGGAETGSGMTSYPVTLEVENMDGSLMDGAWLQYSFVTSQSEDCITVPTSAVKYFSDPDGNRKSVVFVQRDSRPDDVPELDLPEVEMGQPRTFPSEDEGYYPVIVETGISDVQNVEILSGIQEGDNVFVSYTVTDYAY